MSLSALCLGARDLAGGEGDGILMIPDFRSEGGAVFASGCIFFSDHDSVKNKR